MRVLVLVSSDLIEGKSGTLIAASGSETCGLDLPRSKIAKAV